MMKILLELKKKLKSKLPKFTRKDSHKKARIGTDKWRKPKGITNKMRLQLRPHKRIVKTGYRTPKQVRDLNNVGLRVVNVCSIKDIEKINSKEEAVMISSRVSKKTKVDLLELCVSKNISIENVKDAAKELEKIKSDFANKKSSKKKISDSRTAKKEAILKAKAKESKTKTKDEKSEVEKDSAEAKESAKKEKDKILTTKEA